MTVKELMSKLATVPQDAYVIINWEDYAWSDIQDMEYDAESNQLVICHDNCSTIKDIERMCGCEE